MRIIRKQRIMSNRGNAIALPHYVKLAKANVAAQQKADCEHAKSNS
jgi:hypothetical protein